LTRFASQNEAAFAELVMGHSQQADADQRERKQKDLYALKARDRELDKILSKSYEESVCQGRMSNFPKIFISVVSRVIFPCLKIR